MKIVIILPILILLATIITRYFLIKAMKQVVLQLEKQQCEALEAGTDYCRTMNNRLANLETKVVLATTLLEQHVTPPPYQHSNDKLNDKTKDAKVEEDMDHTDEAT
jgi:late competence protein required for DNA uptake (superfamily II DNA/RNA helicase)